MNTATHKRYEVIDVAKAFAIISVVIGHFENTAMPAAYDIMVKVIYMFHMPLFMFASGFIYAATRHEIAYKDFIIKKFKRLMIPYFSTSIIVISIKIASASMLPLDHPVTFRAYMEMFYLPAAEYYLWFIWALWWMMVLIPFFKTVKSRLMLFTFSAILFFCQESFPEVFCLQQTASYMVFFTGGTVISDFMRRYEIPTISTSTQWGSVIVFISLAAYILIDGFIDYDALSIATIMLATNISGIAAFFSLSAMFTRIAGSRALQSALSIASASYIIYLFHTTFEGFAKGIAAKIGVFSWNPTALWCWLGAFSVIACGIMIPWWLGRKILPRWNLTRFLFGLPSRRE